MRYSPGSFSIHAVCQVFYLGSRVLPGLIEKAVFDTMTGQGSAELSVAIGGSWRFMFRWG